MPLPFPGCTLKVEFYQGVQLQHGWSVASVGYSMVQSSNANEFAWVTQPSGTSAQGAVTITMPSCSGPYQCLSTIIVEVWINISGPQGTDPYPPQPVSRGPLTVAKLPALGQSTGSGTGTTTSPSGGTSAPSANVVCAGAATLRGVDVSAYQGLIDWKTVRDSGIAFAYASVGTLSARDVRFATNYPAIKAAGLARGVYQVYDAAGDPMAQVQALLNALGGALPAGDLPPALDVTAAATVVAQGLAPGTTVVANINIWIARVKVITGLTPLLIMNTYALQPSASALASNALWIAQYSSVQCPTLPPGASQWVFWQHSGTGTVPGISGPVDLDTFNGTHSNLRSLEK